MGYPERRGYDGGLRNAVVLAFGTSDERSEAIPPTLSLRCFLVGCDRVQESTPLPQAHVDLALS
jgi:hypothetical protein